MLELVSINGTITKPEEAKISVYDRGFLFGDAIYEVTRSYGKILFAVEDHIARLRRSAEAIGMDLMKSDQEIIREMYDLTKEAKEENIYIRIQVSRGNCAFEQVSLKPSNTSKPNYVMYLHELKNWSPEFYTRGIRLASSRIHRNPKTAMDPNIKSGNYLNNILGILAKKQEADDCILLNPDGSVTEGSTFNVFMVKEGVIHTQEDSANILQGITRHKILELASELNIPVQYNNFHWNDFVACDEAFCSSATKEVMPIHSLDGNIVTSGPGPVTKKLMDAYTKHIESYCEKSKGVHPLAW